MRLLILAAFAWASLVPALAAESNVQVELTVFSCEPDVANQPTLRMVRVPSFDVMPATPTWTHAGAIWKTSLVVPLDHYIIEMKTEHCSAPSVQWVALPGELRHVTAVLNEISIMTIDEDMYAGAIVGALPNRDAKVEILRDDGFLGEQTRIGALVDGNTYQLGHLERGAYVVRVSFGGISVARRVTVPENEYGPVVHADLSPEMALEIVHQEQAGSGHVTFPDTGASKTITTFVLGSASVDGWTNQMMWPADYGTGHQRLSSEALVAVQAVGKFLNADTALPEQLRDFNAWRAHIWENEGRVLLQLMPVDLVLWSHVAKENGYFCHAPGDGHLLTLAYSLKEKSVEVARECP